MAANTRFLYPLIYQNVYRGNPFYQLDLAIGAHSVDCRLQVTKFITLILSPLTITLTIVKNKTRSCRSWLSVRTWTVAWELKKWCISLNGSVILKGTVIQFCPAEQNSKGVCSGIFNSSRFRNMYHQTRCCVMNKFYWEPEIKHSF